MTHFAQQTRLLAKKGRAQALLEKFVEAAELQQTNPACEVLLVGLSVAEADVVHVFEVWTSEAEWKRARASDAIAEWSKAVSKLVAEWPPSIELDSVSGKGI